MDLFRDDLKIVQAEVGQKTESNELNIIKEVKSFDYE